MFKKLLITFLNWMVISKRMESDKTIEVEFKTDVYKKIKLEYVLLALFFIALLYFMSVFDGGHLIHAQGPYNYAAGDMFTFVAFADVAKYENDYTRQPPYIAGGQTDAVNFFSMTGAIIAAELSTFIGAESYDFIIHLNLLFIALSVFIIYLFMRKISVNLALLGLPFSLLMFSWPFNWIIDWGAHLSNVNLIFVVTSLFCLYYLDRKYMAVLLGILNGAGVLAHAREFLMFNVVIAVYFLVRLLKENVLIETIKKPSLIKQFLKENATVISLKNYVLITVPITLFMMFRQLPGVKTIAYGPGYNGPGIPGIFEYIAPSQFHHVYFPQFGFYQYLLWLGVLIALYLIFTNKKKDIDIIALFSLVFLLHGFFSIFNNKTTQIRHLFPVVLIPLIGFLLFAVYSQIQKSAKVRSSIIVGGLFILLLIPTIAYHGPDPVPEYGISNPYIWGAIQWIRQNVASNERVLVLYGDTYNQVTMFSLMRKIHSTAVTETYLANAAKGIISANQTTMWGFPHAYYRQPSFTQIIETIKGERVESICSYDFVLSDKLSQNPKIQNYTITLLKKLINEGNFSIVYQNDLSVVLKNNDIGGKCFKDEVITYGNKP